MRPQKITFGEMRSCDGPTSILVYCADYRCSHSIAMSADQWSEDARLSDIEPRFVCKACGKRGADVRPALWACENGHDCLTLRPHVRAQLGDALQIGINVQFLRDLRFRCAMLGVARQAPNSQSCGNDSAAHDE